MQTAVSAIGTLSDTMMLLVAFFYLFVLHFLKMKCLHSQELCELEKTTLLPSIHFTINTTECVKCIFAH